MMTFGLTVMMVVFISGAVVAYYQEVKRKNAERVEKVWKEIEAASRMEIENQI